MSHLLSFFNFTDAAKDSKHKQVDGDGLINITEFTQFLLSRSGPNKDEWLTEREYL
jgi:hypothetical protein